MKIGNNSIYKSSLDYAIGNNTFFKKKNLSCYEPTDLDAINYINAAGFTNCSLKLLIDDFFKDLKNTGHYSKITHMKLRLTDSTDNATALTQMGINAINPAIGADTFLGFPIANYSGVTYNGINQFSRLNYNPGTDPNLSVDDTTVCGYVYCPGAAYISFGQRSSGLNNIGVLNTNAALVQNFVNDNATIVTFTGLNTSSGFTGASRKNVANTKYIFKNGVAITQTGIGSIGRADLNPVDGGRTLDNVTVANYYNIRTQFVMFGKGLNVAEMATIEPLVNTLQANIDSLFGLTGTNARKRY